MTPRMEKRLFYLMIIILMQFFQPSSSGRRCAPGQEYGDDCYYVPAPPGRTPACAAPGYTYCEQLDHYPNDLIRHLVDKGEYDFSTLLNDETKDDFGATRPSNGPYGYGPHSLSGIQGISLVTEKPTHIPKQHHQPQYQPHGQNQFQGNNAQHNSGQYQNQGQQYYGHNKGNTLPPSNGFAGYFTPDEHQRPQTQPYLPSHDSYLPPKVSNLTLNSDKSASYYQGAQPSGVRLDQYDDFWRGNSYFEVSKTSPFSNSNFHRNNFGPNLEYYDNNGPSPYYSTPRDSASTYYKAVPSGETSWTSDGKREQQYSIGEFVPPAVTSYNPNEWWQRSSSHRRSDSPESSYKSVDSNDIKTKKVEKRDILHKNILRTMKNTKHAFMDSINNTNRTKRQSQDNAGDQLCPTRSQFIMPKAALNKQGNWMYVVNMGEAVDSSYSQLVKSEICVSQQCDRICSLPLGYTSRCEQRYVQKRLVALDQGGQRLYTDIFWFPSCCLCTISQTGS